VRRRDARRRIGPACPARQGPRRGAAPPGGPPREHATRRSRASKRRQPAVASPELDRGKRTGDT
jgi:hypothetical protein